MNILGIDFEDWFHPELFQKHNTTNKNEPKVVEGIDKIIELLRKNETKATFFVVGELLEYKPELLDCLLYTSPSPRDLSTSRMPSSA